MSDEQILVAGTAAAPLTYTVPNAIEAALLCVNATIDGTGASGQFLPTVEIVSDGGVVVARCPCFTTIAAGGSAEVSWFRLSTQTAQSSGYSAYEGLVLSSPLLRAYYKLDETSGTVMHDSGPLGLHGTYVNAPTLGQPPLADQTAVLFNGGASQWGQRTGVANFGATGPQAVAAWIKTSTVPASNMMIVCSDDNNFRYCQMSIQPTGKVEYDVFDAGNANVAGLGSAGPVNDGNRHFIVCTWDAAQLQRIKVDNVVAASQTTALVGQSQRVREIDIGARFVFGAANFFTGTIDEAMIYNGVPPDSYFTAIYNQGLLA
jgi:hypothetical protein